jgi:membrane-bound lytic murein transglycosylase D
MKAKKGDQNRADMAGQAILDMDDLGEDIDNNNEGTLGNLSEPGLAKDDQTVLDEALGFCQVSQDFWGKGDFENAVAALDQAYNLMLQADTNEEPKLTQQKEDIRFLICKRMLEIYASQRTVVNGNHNAIPMVMNRHVEKEIKLFQGRERKFFLQSYKRSGKYRTEILKALEKAGLPPELSWLPLIESGFKVKALSRARALGPWQFIPSTGYKFGLKRDQWIDERMDITKSTAAAIAYLQELHKIFGDWSTVLAAYNCGEFRVLKVIRRQNINYLDDFWDLFERLPWETARYVPRFLAAVQIINDPEKFGFDLSNLDEPLEYETVTVPKQARLKDIAKVLDMPSDILELLNPELRYKVTPPTPYDLKVPTGKGALVTAKLDEVPIYIPPKRFYEYHRVRRGETLSHLARRYRTSVRAIMQANNLRSANYLRVGQRLKIPIRGSWRTIALATQTASTDKSKPLHHRVRRGDSLWLLARAYNTNIQEIMSLNHLPNTNLHIGQTLLIRRGIVPNETNQEGTKPYSVKQGDSPYHIAMAHSMKLERFLRINNLTPRSKIYPGQTLLVDAK